MTPTRKEFMFFSMGEKALFYVLIYLSLGIMFWQVWQRVRTWQKGRPIAEPRNGWKYWVPTQSALKEWSRNVWTYVLIQRKVRSSRPRSGAPMHLAIFYGFMTLLLATTLLGINTYSPVKFHKGLYYLIYEMTTDVMGLVFIVGVAWALVRRVLMARQRTVVLETPNSEAGRLEVAEQKRELRRNPQTTAPADYWALALLLVLGVTGYWLEAARISVDPKPWDWSSPVGRALASLQGNWSSLPYKATLYKSIWWFHAFWVMVFFSVLPRLRIRHIFIAVVSAAGKPDVPMGRLRTVTLEEVEQTEQVGVRVPSDFSRWHLMSLDACMECGRCTEVCPAWGVGKILNPKQIVQDIRNAQRDGDLIANRVSEESLWACTTCNACVEACPVLIRHVDLIVDARRNLVSEGKLSGSAAGMLRQTSSASNAWGAPASAREDWMKDLDVPLCRDKATFEWLFWVGCAGATDPGGVRTTRAVAQLLQQAGIDFACLGREEACTGDPARRVGDEFLFQDKATANVSVFQKYGVRKVVTTCPHCFNTFKNEYGEFGAELEVVHHTQLLAELVSKGALLAADSAKRKVALHDPCYLARVNGESDAPRNLFSSALNEPEHSREKTLCCGAGGGRMWMEEPPSQRPSDRRTKELLDTGAETVAVACPFCRIMIGDALAGAGRDEVRLVDLAELLQEANSGVNAPAT